MLELYLSVVERSFCDPDPCQNGGTCEEHDGTFSCFCPPNLAGDLCQVDLLEAGNLEAGFGGNSYAKIKAPEDIVSRLEIEFTFRAFAGEGVLVYGGDGSSSTDYVVIRLNSSYVQFEYDLGGGPVVLTSANQISLGVWHHVKAKRYHQDGLLEVDDSGRVTGSASGSLRTLNIPSILWIGGQDNAKVGNFVGCLKSLNIGRQPVLLDGENVLESSNIKPCSENPCAKMPCANEGICQADGQGFRCNCQREFTGRHCLKPRNECHPNPCQNRGKCHLSYGSFHCECKQGHFGRLCEKGRPNIDRRIKKR